MDQEFQFHLRLKIWEKDSSSDVDEYMEGQPVDDINTYQPMGEINQPKTLSQVKLSDLTRDLCLSKESVQLLGSRLREKNLLAPGTKFSWYRSHDEEMRQYASYVCGIAEQTNKPMDNETDQ
ncbi:UNVERIFIED_CONTAM: hypothetical protein RMT77_013130 [Armadillidium vulgare]